MEVQLQPTICIVGSGPSGCYSAQFLLKQWPDAQITIVDRLDHPYGLALYGVAPDHHGTRAVTKQFDRLWTNPNVRFIGNVDVGQDVALGELQANFDIVVLATGLHQDRKLAIAGDSMPGVVGAGRVTRLINGHPKELIDGFSLGQRLVIIGQGNVAIDIVRLSLTHPDKLDEVGVPSEVIAAIHDTPISSISVVGRSSCDAAKFDIAMIKELGQLPNVSFNAHFDGAQLETTSAKVIAVQELVSHSLPTAQIKVEFYFGLQPKSIIGQSKAESVLFTSVENPAETIELVADTVITAIGFEENESAAIRREPLKGSHSNLELGFLSEGLYCVGWFRRGPNGTIPANRVDARLVSDSIIRDFQNRQDVGIKPGLGAIKQLQKAIEI